MFPIVLGFIIILLPLTSAAPVKYEEYNYVPGIHASDSRVPYVSDTKIDEVDDVHTIPTTKIDEVDDVNTIPTTKIDDLGVTSVAYSQTEHQVIVVNHQHPTLSDEDLMQYETEFAFERKENRFLVMFLCVGGSIAGLLTVTCLGIRHVYRKRKIKKKDKERKRLKSELDAAVQDGTLHTPDDTPAESIHQKPSHTSSPQKMVSFNIPSSLSSSRSSTPDSLYVLARTGSPPPDDSLSLDEFSSMTSVAAGNILLDIPMNSANAAPIVIIHYGQPGADSSVKIQFSEENNQ